MFIYKYFCKKTEAGQEKINEQEDIFPKLNNDELKQINQEQAKFIYDNAKNALLEISTAAENLTKKAENLFQYLFTIISAICGLYFYTNKTIPIGFLVIVLIIFGIVTYIYLQNFIKPQNLKTVHNIPKNTVSENALLPMNQFYIKESIRIQEVVMSKNMCYLTKKADALYLMVRIVFFAPTVCVLLYLLIMLVGKFL